MKLSRLDRGRSLSPFPRIAIPSIAVALVAALSVFTLAAAGPANHASGEQALPSSGSSTRPVDLGGFARSSASSVVAAALAASLPGVPSRYFEPPPTTHPDAPGRFILTGADLPDPFMLVTGNTAYLYTSEGNQAGVNVPVRSATVIGHWGPVHDALPDLPPWATPGFTWAPDVVAVAGGYALYFTAVVNGISPSMECIGDAFATSPMGPFKAADQPFICQADLRGSIDPRAFLDANGQLWLDWKSDDNADPNTPWPGHSRITKIWAERLSPGGHHLIGTAVEIFHPDEAWQGTIVEAPQMVLVQGHYWLFFSGNWFNQPSYAIGVASCSGPDGPCEDPDPTPWLSSNSQGQGPGEPSLVRDSTGIWLLYNPWASRVPHPTPPRPVAMVRVGFGPQGPYIGRRPPENLSA